MQGQAEDMYAVIATGGKQLTVHEGETVTIEKIDGEPGAEVIFDQVLFVAKDGKYEIGKPVVENATVVGELVKNARGEKIIVFKFKRRKKYRNKTGHRQTHSLVKIKEIRN